MNHSCLHTHTLFCDGNCDVETMCRSAAEKGLVSIGFSSHAPLARKTGIKTDWHLRDEDLDRYISEVEAAGKRWKGKLDVYLGLEADYIPGLCGPADSDFQELPLDYLIGSVHYAVSPKNGELFAVDGPSDTFKTGFRDLFDSDGKALYTAYFDAYCAMAQSGGFDIAGHLDLIKKNNGVSAFFLPDDPAYTEQLRRTARCLAGNFSPVVEVNTGGMNRGCTAEPYPSVQAMTFLREKGLRLTITADAHCTEHLGGHYDEAVSAMKSAGYAGALLFAGKKDGKASWTEEIFP